MLSPWIIEQFPHHEIYVEPYGGAAGVLINKPRSKVEVYNDLDSQVVNFFRIIREPDTREQFIASLELTPYARDEWVAAWKHTDDPLEQARRLCIRAQMSFSSAGATCQHRDGFRTWAQANYAVSKTWAKYPDVIAKVGHRFAGVLIEDMDALEVMRRHDSPSTMHYVDPPYAWEARSSNGGEYRYEMDDAQHQELLEFLHQLEGYVVLSGYPNALYEHLLSDWRMVTRTTRKSSQGGSAKATEVLWLSPNIPEEKTLGLFEAA